MSIRTLRTILAPLATAAMMTFGGVAHAGFYGGDFDPLSFSGYAVFNLSPGCETNGFHVQGVGCLFSLAGLYVTLTATNGDTTKLVVNSNPPAGLGSPNASTPDFLDMWSLYYQNHDLQGVNTGFIGGFKAASTANSEFLGDWWLQFVATPAATLAVSANHQVSVNLDNNVNLYRNYGEDNDCYKLLTLPHDVHTYWSCTGTPADVASIAEGFRSVPNADLPVPEPGTLVLIGGGLVAGWLSRRRKTAA